MPTSAAKAEGRIESSIPQHSQIAIMFARHECRKSGNDLIRYRSQNATMADDPDKNGGPNHLRAWMRFRGVTGAALAEAVGGAVTPGMISELANSKRALSAKWLRRLALHLNTTPGHLLDHDPADIPRDLVDVWLNATAEQRRQLVEVAKAIVRTGTDG